MIQFDQILCWNISAWRSGHHFFLSMCNQAFMIAKNTHIKKMSSTILMCVNRFLSNWFECIHHWAPFHTFQRPWLTKPRQMCSLFLSWLGWNTVCCLGWLVWCISFFLCICLWQWTIHLWWWMLSCSWVAVSQASAPAEGGRSAECDLLFGLLHFLTTSCVSDDASLSVSIMWCQHVATHAAAVCPPVN